MVGGEELVDEPEDVIGVMIGLFVVAEEEVGAESHGFVCYRVIVIVCRGSREST